MRNWLKAIVGVALAAGMLVALARRLSHEARVEPAVKRRVAPSVDAVRARMAADAFALPASLWRQGAIGPCGVAARWGDGAVSAQFCATMKMDGPVTVTRADYRPLFAAALGESGISRKVVQIKPGAATVVRLVRHASFKPKRALFGATELRAAA
jgi:hypothetical protein